jgi:hypothetical protein
LKNLKQSQLSQNNRTYLHANMVYIGLYEFDANANVQENIAIDAISSILTNVRPPLPHPISSPSHLQQSNFHVW